MNKAAGFPDFNRRTAYVIILIFGVVSLFGDIIYEGARSVTGPYLYYLGATAFIVGFVAGFGEFLGYALRLVSGYYVDATGRYWGFTFLGYGMLIAVPFLAFAGSWEMAALLFLLERMGKGIRSPAKDTILSNVTVQVGRGWGFGIHEAMDQIGAVLGPFIFSAVYLFRGEYQLGFALLVIPFVLMMIALFYARSRVPAPNLVEAALVPERTVPDMKALVPYGLFTILTMAGFAAFPVIAFYYSSSGIVPNVQIPALYAVAMGVDAVVALAIGRLYDKKGLIVLALLPMLSFIVPFCAFSSVYWLAIVAAVVWGASMGIQETILRAAVADYTHTSKRGWAYGVFNTLYGTGWFVGNVIIGWLLGFSLPVLVAYIAVMQVAAVAVFFVAKQRMHAGGTA